MTVTIAESCVGTATCVVVPPEPGRALVACGCGAMLDAAAMRWAPKTHAAVVPPIVCPDCARNRSW